MLANLSYQTADAMVRWLPPALIARLARLGAGIAFDLGAPARRVFERNLARLARSPAETRDLARRAFEQFARTLVEMLELERMSGARLLSAIEIRGGEHLAAARASGRGVILLSAHLGNWEWGAAALAARGVPLHVVARRHASAAVEAMFERRRRAFGLARLDARPLWPESARLLRARRWVGLMGDRAAPGTRHSVCAWAAALARRTHALVLPAVTVPAGERRYALVVEPPLGAEDCASGGYRRAMRRHLEDHAGEWCAFEPLPEALA